MQNHHHNVVILVARTPNVTRDYPDHPLAAVTWEDLDMLYTAILGDVIRTVSQLDDTDIRILRNPSDISDDYFLPLRRRVYLYDLDSTQLAGQIQRAVDQAFRDGYNRLVALLDNHPLITVRLLRRVFNLLRYDDDCLVVGPTVDGRCSLVGMKMNHSEIFDPLNGDVFREPFQLLKGVCRIDNILFPVTSGYYLDSIRGIVELRRSLDGLERSNPEFPSKTAEVLKTFDKKYRTRKVAR